ncbi:excitatory amino acid transporter 3 [Rhipicephalus sanguineus]|uniref:excitatory amino acid transporter 3 n=1 Tax=Rhipicephalus sanguineus TaxID=34632 RepID=UPI001895D00A|nr:excitatory amino acid transporter 3 [Rhipicephalus sanguineus]
MYVAFPGDMLLRMLQLCVMPLITASIVAAIGGVDLRLAGRLGRRGFIYYMATTVIAEIEGLALVFLIRPGVNANVQLAKAPPKRVFYLADAIMDIARNMIPPNLVEATLYSWSTKVILPAPPEAGNFTGEEDLEPEFVVERSRGTNVLGLLVFAAFVGSIIAATGERNRAVHDLVVSITDIMMSLIRIVMWYCPAGVGFLIAHRILATGNLGLVLSQLGLYVVTVLVGLAIHMFIVLSALYLVFVRRHSPIIRATACNSCWRGVQESGWSTYRFVLTSTSPLKLCSSATVPVTIATLEDRVGLDPRVVRFMVPVGATVNMDGAALYEAVSAVFLAQLHGVEMDIGRVLAVSVTATVASVGAAGIPGGGLVTMVIVLQAVGLPAEDIGLIATVDWFLDRFRTVVNVIGDCVGAAIVHQLSQADLNVGVVNEDDNALSSAIRPKAFV